MNILMMYCSGACDDLYSGSVAGMCAGGGKTVDCAEIMTFIFLVVVEKKM
jgi:hypothetical protein